MSQAMEVRSDQTNVAVHPASDTTSLLQVITRAASDASVDIDKMERLMAMHERMVARDAKAEFASALAEMQPKLPIIGLRGEIKHGENKPVQSRYALWEDINEAIRPILSEHGFALTFRTGREADKIIVTAVLSHRAGHQEETTMHLPADQSGSKNAVQAVGSSTQYGKRYTTVALLNLTTSGEDDDARVAGAPMAINDQQREELDKLIDATGADEARFFTFFGIEFLAELPAKRFDEAKSMLQAKARK